MGFGEGGGVGEGVGSSFGSEREAARSTISHGAASLVRMGLSGARGGLRFGARPGARECECLCISGERGHRKGLSGMWKGCGVSREGGEGALSDPRGRLVGAQIMFMRAVWLQGDE